MQDVVESNILRFWSTKMVDHEHGGFYGRIDAQEVLHPEAEKGNSQCSYPMVVLCSLSGILSDLTS